MRKLSDERSNALLFNIVAIMLPTLVSGDGTSLLEHCL